MPTEAVTVTVLGQEVRLARPKSPTVAVECVGLLQNSPVRGLGACLGVTWQAGGTRGAPKAKLAACNYNVGQFGGLVVDDLLARGMSLSDLQEVGQVASDLLLRGLVTEQEVKAAEGFSEAGEGSTG